MYRKGFRNAVVGAGHLAMAAGILGAEGAIGELGDAPEHIAGKFIEKAHDPISRATKIFKARLSHNPRAAQAKERENRLRGPAPRRVPSLNRPKPQGFG